MHLGALPMVADRSLLVTIADDAIIGLSIVALLFVFGILAGLGWRGRFASFHSSCEHVLRKPQGVRTSEEGLTYSCAKCDLVIRRRNDDWPPWCSEHPGPVEGRKASTEYWTCAWPRCVAHHGWTGWLRYWRDLVRRWTWSFLDKEFTG